MFNPEKILSDLRKMIPPLLDSFHKGQAGRIAIIGGSENYTGAPFFSCMSSMLFGADLGYIICEPGAGKVIKTYSPDLIVYPLMRLSTRALDTVSSMIVSNISQLLDRLHVIVVGPGLGRDPLMLDTASGIILEARRRRIPIVVDADGLYCIQDKPEIIMGYKDCVLTPNVAEFSRLCHKFHIDENSSCENLANSLGGVTILKKGKIDDISNGLMTLNVNVNGSLRRCGGQGDVLVGILSTLLAWRRAYLENLWEYDSNEAKICIYNTSHDKSLNKDELLMIASYGAAFATRYCSYLAFKRKKRAMRATDLMDAIGEVYELLSEG
ncbi:YjeF family domain-containing protein [Pneumocystis carinii B80]|uniref:ATP-dependent (S)-NAD(P)H-hydrate dehydratase n=1 Tax=Pneumocystis carinii (strain B80) TaxID=1408658 RepID=A0A0W4ZM10_PNEC8|nr:YjeF family domain-containing protein [Pneumocystis carinii B80]KTW29334.1 YjeF family domain-containing protein [Pneumocystis carinii B80]